MHRHESLIQSFYSAFQALDYKSMQNTYHSEAQFYDPVFQHLTAGETKAMWQMLTAASKDLVIKVRDINADENKGTCCWDAWYTFSKTGRHVHNVISASFQFKDGKIFKHHDYFNLWRWSWQALGVSGLLLGWSPLVKNKVRQSARQALKRFMKDQAHGQ